jgi:prevent-host-death family protein
MRTTTITDAKNGLSALIDRVRAGESIVILDRGIPVARLEPVTGDPDPNGRIKRLERAGVISPPSAPPPLELMRTPPPSAAPGVSVLEALLEERETGL